MLDARLVAAISDIFGLRGDDVNPQSGRDTIAGWDSIGHLKLILRVEEIFRLRFPAAQIAGLVSAAEIQEAINRLQAAKSGSS
jgi:acyl carrier protein